MWKCWKTKHQPWEMKTKNYKKEILKTQSSPSQYSNSDEQHWCDVCSYTLLFTIYLYFILSSSRRFWKQQHFTEHRIWWWWNDIGHLHFMSISSSTMPTSDMSVNLSRVNTNTSSTFNLVTPSSSNTNDTKDPSWFPARQQKCLLWSRWYEKDCERSW